jgi:hypothetical protein
LPHFHSLRAEEISVVVGDNSEHGVHLSGYNGLWHLSSVHDPSSFFLPEYCGMNFEFIAPKSPDDSVEPKDHPTELVVDEPETQVTLHQSPTPTHWVESWMTYRVAGPAHLDWTFRFRLHEPVAFPSGFAGFFFASYINQPENKALYLLSRSVYDTLMWIQFCSAFQGRDCAIVWEQEVYDLRFGDHEHGLYTSLAPIQYHVPLFLGRRGDMAFALFFEQPLGVVISHGMGGGGFVDDRSDRNPAWDFFLYSRDPTTVQEGVWRGRLLYKRFAGRKDVLEEYATFQESIGRKWTAPLMGQS